jgi:6-phosphofructokinase 2
LILTVTPDAALEHVSVVRGFAVGARLHALRTHVVPGGAGIRVATAVHALGGATLVCGFAGGHSGTLLRRALDSLSIRHDLVEVKAETGSHVCVVDESQGDVFELSERGSPVTSHDVAQLIDRVDGSLELANLLVLAGDLPPGAPEDLFQSLAAAAGKRGKRVLLDVRSEPLRRALAERPTLALVDWSDLELLLAAPVDDEYALREAVPKLARARGVPILLPLGVGGAFLATGERAVRYEPREVRAWNSIGTRETLLGALAWHFADRGELLEAVRFGCAAAAAKLGSEKPVHVDPREVEDLLPSIHVHDSSAPGTTR